MTWHTITESFDLSIYLQGLAGESSPTCSSITRSSELAKSRNTQETYCFKDSETESCHSSQSGMMSAHSTENLGAVQLTLFVGDSLVKTSARQEKELELLEKGRDFGRNICALFQKFGHPIFSQKTLLSCESVDLTSSSPILPNWGIMQDGVCLDIGISEDRSTETECGYAPAPVKNMGEGFIGGPIRKSETWLSACRQDHWLIGTWKKWKARENGGNSREKIIAHPTFSAWSMGWPKNWTSLKPLGMDKFHKWQRQHSEFFHK